MQFIEKEICEYTENIWNSILSLEVKPDPTESEKSVKGYALAGCIHITGAWEGTVTIDFPMSLAKQVASIMFNLNGKNTELYLIQDALGELTNMTGGNIKSLLPEPCYLSMPTVAITDSAMRIIGSELVTAVTFKCNEDNFKVSLLKKVEKDATE